MPRLRWLSPLLALLLVGALGPGCAGIAQRVGTRYLTRQVDDVFALDGAQEERVHASIEGLIDELPSLVDPDLSRLVRDMDRTLAAGATEESLRSLERQGDALADRIAIRIIDEAVPHALSLRDPQITHAVAWAREELEDRREELRVSAAARLEERQDDFVEAVEEWTGDLSGRQEAALRAHVAAQRDEEALWLAAGERRLRSIERTLRGRPDAPALRAELITLWRDREELGPGAPSVAERRARGRRTLLFVDGMITPSQRQHARTRLAEQDARLRRFLGSDA